MSTPPDPGRPSRDAPVQASWATGSTASAGRRVRRLLTGTAADLRWLGHEALRRRPRPDDEPGTDPIPIPSETRPRMESTGDAPASWARTRPVRAVRGLLQSAALKPFLRAELTMESFGADAASDRQPVVLVANHASHLDALVIAASLPRDLRRRLAVAASADYFFDAWWRAIPSALLVNSLPLHEGTDAVVEVQRLLDGGWAVLVFGEPSRSDDGSVHPFDPQVGALALRVTAPIVPVGVRGTFSAMPRGRFRIRTGRPRVSVRFGAPMRPQPAESADGFTTRVTEAVRELIAEDTHTWWRVLTGDTGTDAAHEPGPAAARWRRIWAQTDVMAKGGGPTRNRIWS